MVRLDGSVMLKADEVDPCFAGRTKRTFQLTQTNVRQLLSFALEIIALLFQSRTKESSKT
jgi:hypothetical protein